MNVVLFDKCSVRREAWEKLVNQHAVSLKSFDTVSDQAIVPTEFEQPRVIIVDQSALEDYSTDCCLTAAQRLIPKLRKDLVAFSLADYRASTIVHLLQHGAAWVFDNALTPAIVEADFAEVMRLASNLHDRYRTHLHMQSILGKVTPAEREVLALVLEGMPNKSIAKQLNISVRTVESRRSKIYRKCNVKSITALVRFADQAESLRIQFESQADAISANPTSAVPSNNLQATYQVAQTTDQVA